MRGEYNINILLKELIKDVEKEFKKENLVKQLKLKQHRGDDEDLTTGTVICRFGDEENSGNFCYK